MTDRGHEFLTLADGQWCLCCDLFERRPKGDFTRPTSSCPRDTSYAENFSANKDKRVSDADV